MSIEYIASINEADYSAFRIIITTPLPDDYDMWLRVRDRGKLRALTERGALLTEIEISPTEFGAYCRGLKRPDFSIAGLDRCAREKAVAQGREAFTQGGLAAGPGPVRMVHDALVASPQPATGRGSRSEKCADVKPHRIKMPVDYAAPSADFTAAVGCNYQPCEPTGGSDGSTCRDR